MDTCQRIDPAKYGFIAAPTDKRYNLILKEKYGSDTLRLPAHDAALHDASLTAAARKLLLEASLQPVNFAEARTKFQELCKLLLPLLPATATPSPFFSLFPLH